MSNVLVANFGGSQRPVSSDFQKFTPDELQAILQFQADMLGKRFVTDYALTTNTEPCAYYSGFFRVNGAEILRTHLVKNKPSSSCSLFLAMVSQNQIYHGDDFKQAMDRMYQVSEAMHLSDTHPRPSHLTLVQS